MNRVSLVLPLSCAQARRRALARLSAGIGLVVGLGALVPAWAAPPVVSCASSAADIFNTGTNGAGGVLANGTDLSWEVSRPGITNNALTAGNYAAVPAANWVPAVIVSNPVGAWRANAADAAWIAQVDTGLQNPYTNADVFYRIRFTLDPSVDPSTFQLSMNFWADNSVAEVWVNGVAQSGRPGVGALPQSPANPYQALYFTAAAPLTSYVFGHDWQAGDNTLVVNVKTGVDYVGLLARFSTAPLCRPGVHIDKSADTGAALPAGGNVTYTVTVTNTGAVDAANVRVHDDFPDGIASANWTCAGAACPAANSGGDRAPPATLLDETIANLPAGGAVTYTIAATAGADPLPSPIVNVVTAGVPGDGLCTDAAGKPTGEPMPCPAAVSNPARPILEITKIASTPGPLVPGGDVTYTIVVTNMGVVEDATNVPVHDDFPPGVVSADWTCTGAACPAASSGGVRKPPTTLLDQTIALLPPGASVTYTIHAQVAAGGLPANIVNTATVDAPGGICVNGHPMPCQSVTTSNPLLKLAGAASSVPALAPPALALLALLLGGLAWQARKSRHV